MMMRQSKTGFYLDPIQKQKSSVSNGIQKEFEEDKVLVHLSYPPFADRAFRSRERYAEART